MSTTRHDEAGCEFDAVVAVGSQGALESFLVVLASLPVGFPAAVVISLHRGDSYDVLERVLRHQCSLPVQLAADGAAIRPGQVYVAPHDRQLVIGEDLRLRVLGSGDWVRQRFPDALLASAARALGARLIGVVLSG